MHRALRIAATCSVALHATTLAVSGYLFDGASSPSIASRVLVLTVETPPADTYAEAEPSRADGVPVDPPPAAPTQVAGTTAAPDNGAPDMPATDLAPPAAASSGMLREDPLVDANVPADAAQRTETGSDADREDDPTDRTTVGLVASSSDSAERIAGVQADAGAGVRESADSAAMSPRQQQMLNRKIRQWTRSADRLAKVDRLHWQHQGQEYVATSTELRTADDQAIEEVIVAISTETGGKTFSTEIRMRRLAFSNYAQFVNRWDPNVGFHDDELDGRFHSNTEITVAGDRRSAPRFHGKVTTAAHSVDYGDKPGYVRRDAIFLGGLETSVGSIRFPERFVPFPADTDARKDRVHYFEEDTHITFYADGTYGWRPVGSAAGERRAAISKESSYLIAAAGAELHVEGTLDGKVLLYSPERIVVDGDLVYAQEPATVPEADDYLGLVSDKYVDIAAAEVTGPGDLTIDAAIYAKRSFTVRDYGARGGGLLDIYGSLTAGSLSATEPRYRTRIRFDPRLEKLRPPAFPMTDRYEVESWDGVWRVGAVDTR